MGTFTLTRDEYRDRVLGGWTAKCAGTTLGALAGPGLGTRAGSESAGSTAPNDLRYYDPLPGQAVASDELDFQLVWLHALREGGPEITPQQLCAAWTDHILYPWDEYGYSSYNLRRGLEPPITGAFNNWFKHCAAGAGRADLWAMVAPGSPQVAAEYAYRDASIDHSGEGVWAAMFWSALESAAFVHQDRASLVEIGLAMVPGDCRVSAAARIAVAARRAGVSTIEARARIIAGVGSDSVTDAPQNVGFAVMGLLYGEGDFGRAVTTTVNCGYDTDTTGGMIGALEGILQGRRALPAEWADPIGDHVVLGWGVVGLDVERTLGELTDHVVDAGAAVVAVRCPDVELADGSGQTEAAPVSTTQQTRRLDEAPDAAPPDTATVDHARFLELDDTPAGGSPPKVPMNATPPAAAADAPAARAVGQAPASTAPAAPADSEGAAPAAGLSGGGGFSRPVAESGVSQPAVAVPAPAPSPAPAPAPPTLVQNSRAQALAKAPANTAVYTAGAFEVTVDYGDTGPSLVPNAATSFTAAIRNLSDQRFVGFVQVSVPAGWQVAVPGNQGQRQMLAPQGMARYGFVVRVPEDAHLESRNAVALVLTPEKGAATSCDIRFLSGSCWWWVGPFANMADEGFNKVYPIEDQVRYDDTYLGRSGGLLRWQKLAFREIVMPVEPLFGGAPGVAYGTLTLRTAAPRRVRLLASTNDGLKLWLNGQRVLQRHSHDPFRPTIGYGPGIIDVDLRAGDNRVLVKLVRCIEPVEFAFAVTDQDGHPVPDVEMHRW